MLSISETSLIHPWEPSRLLAAGGTCQRHQHCRQCLRQYLWRWRRIAAPHWGRRHAWRSDTRFRAVSTPRCSAALRGII